MLELRKVCSRCRHLKDADQFGKNKAKFDGLDGYCKKCSRAIVRKAYEHNPKQNIHRCRLRRTHCTQETLDKLREDQQGLCAVCGNPETKRSMSGGIRDLSIDHCHETKTVRGLLCMKCNLAIGHMNDDPELLRKAANYLEGKL